MTYETKQDTGDALGLLPHDDRLGDFLYGEEHDALIGRQALHCRKTAFDHPVSGRRMTLTAALPDDFLSLMNCFDLDEGTVNQ